MVENKLPSHLRTSAKRCPRCGRDTLKKHLFDGYWMCQSKGCSYRHDDPK